MIQFISTLRKVYNICLTTVYYWINKGYLTAERAPGPFKPEGSYNEISPRFMEIIWNVISVRSRYQEPASIWWFVTWPINILRSLSYTQWSDEKFSWMVFPHHLGMSQDHFRDHHTAVPIGNLPRGYHSLEPLQLPWIIIDGSILRIHQPSRPFLHHLHPWGLPPSRFHWKSHGGGTVRTRRASGDSTSKGCTGSKASCSI